MGDYEVRRNCMTEMGKWHFYYDNHMEKFNTLFNAENEINFV